MARKTNSLPYSLRVQSVDALTCATNCTLLVVSALLLVMLLFGAMGGLPMMGAWGSGMMGGGSYGMMGALGNGAWLAGFAWMLAYAAVWTFILSWLLANAYNLVIAPATGGYHLTVRPDDE